MLLMVKLVVFVVGGDVEECIESIDAFLSA